MIEFQNSLDAKCSSSKPKWIILCKRIEYVSRHFTCPFYTRSNDINVWHKSCNRCVATVWQLTETTSHNINNTISNIKPRTRFFNCMYDNLFAWVTNKKNILYRLAGDLTQTFGLRHKSGNYSFGVNFNGSDFGRSGFLTTRNVISHISFTILYSYCFFFEYEAFVLFSLQKSQQSHKSSIFRIIWQFNEDFACCILMSRNNYT